MPDNIEKKLLKQPKRTESRRPEDQALGDPNDQSPQAVVDAAGVAPDFPDLSEIRKGYGKDSRREQMR